jgi:uncharacterized protein (TIGR00369 family)
MEARTHLDAHKPLLGTPIEIIDGEKAVVRLVAIENMIVDSYGLVHGGFTFGLADYAAMLAVNDPNVVIGSADVKFLAPVQRGEVMIAEANVTDVQNKKRVVEVSVNVGEKTALSGVLTCFVLEKHVLSSNRNI